MTWIPINERALLAGNRPLARILQDLQRTLLITDGLLLIRYLFGFSRDSLISDAIGDGAERVTAEEVEAYIKERVPVQ